MPFLQRSDRNGIVSVLLIKSTKRVIFLSCFNLIVATESHISYYAFYQKAMCKRYLKQKQRLITLSLK